MILPDVSDTNSRTCCCGCSRAEMWRTTRADMRLHYEGTEDVESRILNRSHNKIPGNDRKTWEKEFIVCRFEGDGRLIRKRGEVSGCCETPRTIVRAIEKDRIENQTV